MTLIPIEPFKGATRNGVEAIRSAISVANNASFSAISEAMGRNNETVVEIFHPSERAAELEWVNSKEIRENVRKSMMRVPFLGAAYVVALSIGAWALVPVMERASGMPQSNPPIAFFAVMGFFLAAFITGSSFRELFKEYRLGFTSWFTLAMRFRLATAWATSKEAVYAARLSRTEEELIEVARVPFSEIQACSYAVYDGITVAHLYTKAGICYTLAEPAGSTISGATTLANHVWSLTKSTSGIEEKLSTGV